MKNNKPADMALIKMAHHCYFWLLSCGLEKEVLKSFVSETSPPDCGSDVEIVSRFEDPNQIHLFE